MTSFYYCTNSNYSVYGLISFYYSTQLTVWYPLLQHSVNSLTSFSPCSLICVHKLLSFSSTSSIHLKASVGILLSSCWSFQNFRNAWKQHTWNVKRSSKKGYIILSFLIWLGEKFIKKNLLSICKTSLFTNYFKLFFFQPKEDWIVFMKKRQHIQVNTLKSKSETDNLSIATCTRC